MNTWVGDPQSHSRPIEETLGTNTGGFIITKTDLGVPYWKLWYNGPQNPTDPLKGTLPLFIKAPTLRLVGLRMVKLGIGQRV